MDIRFSIPFNGDNELAAEAAASGKAAEIYFAVPEAGSGATQHFGIPDAADIKEEAGKLASLLIMCRRKKIKTNMLCNAPSLYGKTDKIRENIRIMKPDAVTVADPLYIDFFRRNFPDVELQASVIMNIDSAEKARQAFRAGVKVIAPAAEVNRNIDVLRNIAAVRDSFASAQIKLMTNYYCGYDCLYRTAHYAGRQNGCFPEGRDCYFQQGSPSEVLKRPFIRPEDLHFYADSGLADIFKLIARYQPSEQLRKIYSAYFSGRYDGNIFDIIGGGRANYGHGENNFLRNSAIPDEFVSKVTSCGKDCGKCGWCAAVYAEALE